LEIEIAVLADAANVSREGKLNILGIFEDIMGAPLPLTHAFMVLVLLIRANPLEKGQNHQIAVRLMDQDGKTIQQFPELRIGLAAEASGSRVSIPVPMGLGNLHFTHYGAYRFEVRINGQHARDVELNVKPLPPNRP
jgi:hypothetical protein